MALGGTLVKNVLVRIKSDGATDAKDKLAEIAAEARAIGDMDPKIKVKVDPDALRKLTAMRVEMKALTDAKDSEGLKDLAKRFEGIGASAGDARTKLSALRLTMDALRASERAAADELGGGGGSGILGKLVTGFGSGGGLGQLATSPAAWVAALAALPFIAQAAAAAITLTLGGALAAMGIYAASKTKGVQKNFKDLETEAMKDFTGIGAPFVKTLDGIMKTAGQVLPGIAKTFKEAIVPIAGPLEAFGKQFLRVFADPQVAASIKAIGTAFGAVVKALTPQLAGDAAAVADGITNIARAVSKNPKAIAEMVSGLFHLAGALLDTIAWLTQAAGYLEDHFIPAFKRAGGALANWTSETESFFVKWGHDVEHEFDTVGSFIVSTWNMAWRNTISRTANGVSETIQLVASLPGRIRGAVASFPGLLYGAGQALLEGLVHGIQSEIGSVISQVVGLGSSILSHIRSALGIGSPSRITFYHGQMLAAGLALGMDDGRGIVSAAAMRLAHSAAGTGPMVAAGGGGVLRLEVTGGGGGALDQLFISWLRKYVRVAGGGGTQSVQRALGQEWR